VVFRWRFTAGASSDFDLGSSFRHRRDAIRAGAGQEDSWKPLPLVFAVVAFNGLFDELLEPEFFRKIHRGRITAGHTGAAQPALPSTAHAETSLQHLWLFDAPVYLPASTSRWSCATAACCAAAAFLAGANGVVLSVFGTRKNDRQRIIFWRGQIAQSRFLRDVHLVESLGGLRGPARGRRGPGIIFRFMRRHDGSARRTRSCCGASPACW